jgi:hypothetical protein
MTPVNLARHRTNPNMAFWKMIKEGNDHFEATRLEPKVEVCNRHYVFDAQQPPNSSKPIVFNPTARCPAFVVAPEIAGPALEKEHADELQYAQLVKANVWVAPIRTGLDGGMNRVFLAQVGSIPPARTTETLPPQPAPVTEAAQSTGSSHWFGGLFGSKPATQVAATDSGSQERGGGFFGNLFSSNSTGTQQANAAGGLRGSEPTTTGTTASRKSNQVAHNESASAAGLRPKAKTEPGKAEPKSEPQEASGAKPTAPLQQAYAATPPASNGSLLKGAQPVVPTGSFDSRWTGQQ